jgi:putative DNA primase/helicase|tara:strand:+ start:1669 stop:2484 length:816 start_codon:yes stop_codon:yes gene_type:complete
MTSFVFIGEQGSGKGVTLEHIIKPLFGTSQVDQVEDEELKSSFNGWILNKCFIAFNEVAHDNKGRNSLNSKIKSIITDPVVTINDKHLRTYTIKNSINTVFFSNEHIPVLVERNDRRFNIIKTGGNLRKLNWFKPTSVFNNIKCELNSFAQYLWNLKVDLDKANEVMDNDAKTALIEIGQNMYEEFATHLKGNDVTWFVDNMDTDSYQCPSEVEVTMIQPNKIPKDIAVKLFNSLHPGKHITTNQLTKYMKLYGIYPDRDNDKNRTRIYSW